MKKIERIVKITKLLTDNPNKLFHITNLAADFDCAKSSISEDIKEITEIINNSGNGYLEITQGVKGGIKYIPCISKERIKEILEKFRDLLDNESRHLYDGFLYTSDLMFMPNLVSDLALVFATVFKDSGAEQVVCVETKGIGVSLLTAKLLNLPLAVIKHEPKISEGSTISINYFSGSQDKVSKLSINKNGIKRNSKAIIIDDFLRGGGSLNGMADMVKEFGTEIVGIGITISSSKKEKVGNTEIVPLVKITENAYTKYNISINEQLVK